MSRELEQFQHEISTARRINKLSRRRFSQLTLAMGCLAMDRYVANKLQEERSVTTITELEHEEAHVNFPNAAWLVLPGFKMGWDDSRLIASKLSEPMSRRGRIAYMGYSNEGFDIDEVKHEVTDFTEKQGIENLYIFGHSFGGMVAKEVASYLKDRSGAKVDLIVADSSPSSRYVVRDGLQLNVLASMHTAQLPLPLMARGSFEIGERAFNKHERTWAQVYHQSREQLLPTAPSSLLIKSQAQYINRYDINAHPLAPSTKVAMIANMADETVNISRATKEWADACGDQFEGVCWTHARPAHASPQWNPDEYGRYLSLISSIHLPLESNDYDRFLDIPDEPSR